MTSPKCASKSKLRPVAASSRLMEPNVDFEKEIVVLFQKLEEATITLEPPAKAEAGNIEMMEIDELRRFALSLKFPAVTFSTSS